MLFGCRSDDIARGNSPYETVRLSMQLSLQHYFRCLLNLRAVKLMKLPYAVCQRQIYQCTLVLFKSSCLYTRKLQIFVQEQASKISVNLIKYLCNYRLVTSQTKSRHVTMTSIL